MDYVIIHELAHLKHLDHSQNFWQLVGEYYPDHHQAKRWLRQNENVASAPSLSKCKKL